MSNPLFRRVPCCSCGQHVLAPALPPGGIDLERWIDGLAWSMIDQALERARGNKSQAARLLGLKRTTLVQRLKRPGAPGSAA